MYILPDEMMDEKYDFHIVGDFETNRLVLEELARYIIACALMDPSGHFLKTFLRNACLQMKKHEKDRGKMFPNNPFIKEYYASIFVYSTKVLTDSAWEWLGVAASNVGPEFSPLESRSNTRVDEGLKLVVSIASERKFDSESAFMKYLREICSKVLDQLD